MRESANYLSDKIVPLLRKFVLFFILLIIILLFSILSPEFLTLTNIINIINQNAYLIIAAIGLSMVMISGGVDLSIGYQISVVGVCTAMLMKNAGLPVVTSVILGLLIGTLLGFINGMVSNILRIHPMIVTLATMTLFEGISYLISQSHAIYDLDPSFKFIGQGYVGVISVPLIIVLVVALSVDFILRKTYFGRYIYAVGSNPEAARLSGINVNLIKLIVFVFCGFLVGLSAIVMVARAGSANSSMGPGTEFNAITAAVLGGISFIGGEGSVIGVVIGTIILGVLSNGMQLIGLGIYSQYVVKGLILLGAIGFDTYQKNRKTKKISLEKN